jgi:hypothetical protein
MMRYHYKMWTNILLESARILLYDMISARAAFGVLFAGMGVERMLQAFGVSIYIQNACFIPCACYFLWAFCIGIIDINIERDVL